MLTLSGVGHHAKMMFPTVSTGCYPRTTSNTCGMGNLRGRFRGWFEETRPGRPRLVRVVSGRWLARPPALRGFALAHPALRGFALAHPPTLRLPVSHKVARFLRVFGQPYATAATLRDGGNLTRRRQPYVTPATLDAHRGRPDCLESVNCCWLVVEVGADATPCHKGASCALRSEFGWHNGVIQGHLGPNSLR